MELAGVGIWSTALRYGDPVAVTDAAAEIEELGYTALWIPDGGGPVFEAVGHLLSATGDVVVATGVLNLWMQTATASAAAHAVLAAEHGDRFLLGIGVSHAARVDQDEPGRYRQPMAAMATFLDDLDAADPPVPPQSRVLAALGPKMLALAAQRSRGVHPYLVTPEHTAVAREAVGPEALVLPEQTVVLCANAERARELGDTWLRRYLAMPNYANSLLRLGFTAEDLSTVSERLFDALIAWGDEEVIKRRVEEHFAAGADHVCLQVLSDVPGGLPLDDWRRLAAALS